MKKKHHFLIWSFIVCLVFFSGMVVKVQGADTISLTGFVRKMSPPPTTPPEGGGTPGPQMLGGANVSLISNPGISTTSSSAVATLGKFTLTGIPANQLHWFKVTATGCLNTNIGVQVGSTNIDTSVPSGCGMPPYPPCNLYQLMAISDTMKTDIESRSMISFNSNEGHVIVELTSSDNSDLGIFNYATQTYNKQVRFYVDGNGPIPPGQYYEISPGRAYLIPNITPGTRTITVEVDGLVVPTMTYPIFAGEVSFGHIIITPDATSLGTIKGKVTKENGTAIPGATVTAMPEFGVPVSAITGTDGLYEIKGLPVGRYKVQASAASYAQQFYYSIDRWDLASPIYVGANQTTEDIDFILSPAHSISGKVYAGGSPVANAWVNASSQGLQNSAGASTDADGNYSISVRPASDYRVDVSVSGYAQQFYNSKKGWMEADLVDVTNGNATGIDFYLLSGKSISGKITESDGTTPVPYIWVNAHSNSTGSDSGSNTKEDGTYTITVSPAPDYIVMANKPGSPQVFFGGHGGQPSTSSYDKAALVDVTANNATGVDIRMISGNTIKGSVKKDDGTGIANITVNAFGPTGWGNAVTDTSGNFTINVPTATGYRVEAFSDSYPRVMWKCNTISNTENNIYEAGETCLASASTTLWNEATEISTEKGSVTGVNIIMKTGVTVSGSVKKDDNTPLAGVWVNANSDTAMTWGGGQTNSKGEFSFNVPPATGYRINMNHPEYPNLFYVTTNVNTCSTDCADADPTGDFSHATVFDFSSSGAKGVDFVVKTTVMGTISGTVMAGKVPVSGAWINAWSENCMYGVGEPSKADGKYTLKVLPNNCKYKVEAFADRLIRKFYNDKYDWMDADEVLVSDASPNRTNINFNLSSGNQISGTVTYNGNAVSGIWVNAHSETNMSGGGAETDSAGKYSINVKPASDYRVGVWHPNYVPQMWNNKADWMQADLVDTSSGSRDNINFALSQGISIKGTVKKDGSAITDNKGWVNAFSEKTGSGAGGPIQTDGTYSIKVSPATDYRVEVFHPDYGRQFYNNTQRWDMATLVNASTVNASTSDVTSIDFNLSSGRSISGKITDENGNGKIGAWVNAWSEDLMAGSGEMTKQDGTYAIKGLAVGTGYRVQVFSNDPTANYANAFYKEGSSTGTTNFTDATLIDLTSGDKTGANIKLSTGGSIKGTVKATGGLSGNIFVDVFSQSLMIGRGEPLKYNAGDIEKQFTLKGLPPATDYKVHVMADNFGNRFYKNGSDGTNDWGQATEVTVNGNDVTLANAISLTSGGSISGTIYHTNKDAANVIRNGWVQAMNPDKGEFQGSPIKPDGTYNINGLTVDTKYTVQATPFDYTPTFYDPNSTNSSTTNWVAPNVTASTSGTTGIDIVVSKGYTISGRVLDDDGTTPVQYAFIGVFGINDDGTGKEKTPNDMDDNTFYWSPITDGAGYYRTPPLFPGKYLVAANKEGKGKTLYRKDKNKAIESGNIEIEISNADLTNIDISFKMPDANKPGSIAGTITNSSGVTRDEIQVILYVCSDDPCSSSKVEASTSKKNIANGGTASYSFSKVKPGKYKIKALGLSSSGNPPPLPSYKWYNNKADKNSADVINVSAGTPVTGIDITLLAP